MDFGDLMVFTPSFDWESISLESTREELEMVSTFFYGDFKGILVSPFLFSSGVKALGLP